MTPYTNCISCPKGHLMKFELMVRGIENVQDRYEPYCKQCRGFYPMIKINPRVELAKLR